MPDTVLPIQRTSSVEELAGIYSAANVFINMTYEDTFPTVNLEALGCGTPVYTYKTGGSPEPITASCGEILPKGDINAVRKTICMMKQKNEFICRRQAKSYCKENLYAKYEYLYENIVQE